MGSMAVPPELLQDLVCPETRTPLVYFEATDEREAFLFSPASRLQFAIVDGVPDLVIDRATRLDPDAAAALMATRESAPER